jgi:hypothetical protein
MTLHIVAGSAPETLDRFTTDWQRWSATSWQQAIRQTSIAYATAVHAGAQLFQLAALSASYGAQTLGAVADLLVTSPEGSGGQREDRPVLAAVPDVPAPAVPVPADAAPQAPPVPRWDELTLGSIRGQLRRWDVETLEALHAYEVQHGNRPAVVSMLANRIAKTRVGKE